MTGMFRLLGINRAFLGNPVTWIVGMFIAVAAVSVVRAERHYDYTCALAAPIHGGVVNIPEYYVQPIDTIAYELCKGRIPDRWKNLWPLADCRPGGVAHYSDGSRAQFPQKCLRESGNTWVY